ncbi:FtsW/RodA/SpoVE family cell cycle protein [Clostridium omnivorum]|uniref:Cell division protein FtsW n=1 Tax=Clostridium omnivorum TaxID=1604902 RepID=A0ABQ5N6V0_9CLOT|nr:FtsW/RodA/SpoVE family cell cycle protein [Clostridium sp. E14]GLC30949.1 cell division protein FtsW [Clostridium sp. E14]
MGLNSNEIIGEYIKNVCSLVKNKDAHEEIKLELENHILELSDELISEGTKESEATEKAIAQMGDATVVGSQLNKAHKGNPDWTLLIITLLLSGFGLLSMYFIKISGLASEEVFYKNLGYFVIGIAIVTGIYFFDYRKLRKYSKYIYIVTLFFAMLAAFTGPQSNGRIHLSLFFTVWNFLDLSVFILIISSCGIFSDWDFSKLENKLKGIGLLALPLLLIASAPSVSACAIYVISFIVLLFGSKANYKYILLIVCALFGLSFFFVLSEPYRISRMLTFVNPQKDPQGAGYLIIQVKKLLIGAGFFGKGLTLTRQALPEPHTDLIFAYIIYTFGWFAGLSIVALASAFIVRIISLATSVKDTYGKLLIKGIAAIFAVEFSWNILMVLGFAPLVGMSLPFISYGGSQFIMNMIAIGLISSVYKRRTLTVSVRADN